MRIVGLRWLVSFAGTGAFAGLVWTFGPLLPQLETSTNRLGLVLAIVLIWCGLNAAMDWRARQADRVLAQGVVKGAADEAAAIRDKLEAALRSLTKTQGSLHDRPWYAIIGPPGAGKTTALHNAGLRFPIGRDPLRGVGGTRYCDWWFTEDAVLIDTAGRYTTQDSDAEADRSGWEAFLDLLRTSRPRQPLNGVIVAIALSDVAKADAEERMAHARAIRRRVRELQTRLGLRLPIYLLFTKADLIAGFSEFFADMDAAQRAQVWGITFDPAADESDCADLFTRGFRLLVERLGTRLFERLRDERNAARRGLIAMFPSQVASLEQPLTEFIKAAFTGYHVQLIPRVRGVYLSSATQEGTPFDRLTGALSRTFGLEQRRAATLQPGQGRSFFLECLLRDVIFNEAMLVSEPPAIQRRRKLVQAGGLAAVALAAVAVCAFTWHLRASALRQVDAGAADIVAFEQAAQGVQLDPVQDADLPRVLPMLDVARAAGLGGEENAWLSQSAKLTAGGKVLYRHALERALLPRLIWQMETTVRDNLNNPDFLYEATRVYLMLGGRGPLDGSFVHEWMRLAWQTLYPGPAFEAQRERLLGHLDALLAGPLPSVPLDGQLVARARMVLGKVSIAQRAYSAIRLSPAAQRPAPWRPSDYLSVAGSTLFRRTSGKSLNVGVAGFYTVEGFHSVLLPSMQRAARDAVTESWVGGLRIDIDPKGPAMGGVERDVIGLYESDYQQTWDAMLADLNLAPLSSVSQAAQDLFILASPQSPIRSLLVSIARELTLSVPPGQRRGAAEIAPDSNAGPLRNLLGSASAAQRPQAPGQDIDLRYAALRQLSGSGEAAPIDQVLRSLNDMQQQFARAAATIGSGALSTGPDPALAVKVEALRQPEPLSRWLLTLAVSGSALRNAEAKR